MGQEQGAETAPAHVLIIDDNLAYAENLAEVLESSGCLSAVFRDRGGGPSGGPRFSRERGDHRLPTAGDERHRADRPDHPRAGVASRHRDQRLRRRGCRRRGQGAGRRVPCQAGRPATDRAVHPEPARPGLIEPRQSMAAAPLVGPSHMQGMGARHHCSHSRSASWKEERMPDAQSILSRPEVDRQRWSRWRRRLACRRRPVRAGARARVETFPAPGGAAPVGPGRVGRHRRVHPRESVQRRDVRRHRGRAGRDRVAPRSGRGAGRHDRGPDRGRRADRVRLAVPALSRARARRRPISTPPRWASSPARRWRSSSASAWCRAGSRRARGRSRWPQRACSMASSASFASVSGWISSWSRAPWPSSCRPSGCAARAPKPSRRRSSSPTRSSAARSA